MWVPSADNNQESILKFRFIDHVITYAAYIRTSRPVRGRGIGNLYDAPVAQIGGPSRAGQKSDERYYDANKPIKTRTSCWERTSHSCSTPEISTDDNQRNGLGDGCCDGSETKRNHSFKPHRSVPYCIVWSQCQSAERPWHTNSSQPGSALPICQPLSIVGKHW
jgi:hypothetical protein